MDAITRDSTKLRSTADLIGQAPGVTMERTRVNADSAFHVLAETSQHCNAPLRVVAQELIDSLPDARAESSAQMVRTPFRP